MENKTKKEKVKQNESESKGALRERDIIKEVYPLE